MNLTEAVIENPETKILNCLLFFHIEAPKSTTIIGINILSLRFRQPDFALLLDTMTIKPDIILLTETWLTENDPIDNLNISSYQPLESKPRTFSQRSIGGVGA